MMNIQFGVNTGFALNRFSTPEQWVRLIGETLGVRIVQLTADFINPHLPDEIIDDQAANVARRACDQCVFTVYVCLVAHESFLFHIGCSMAGTRFVPEIDVGRSAC